MKKEVFKDGHYQHLAEICHDESEVYDQLKEFETYFYKYHSHILVTAWRWRRESQEPYVFIDFIGIFDSLNLMALRIKNIIASNYDEKPTDISTLFTSDELEIDLKDGLSIRCQFVPFNRVDECQESEGWKFDIPKE